MRYTVSAKDKIIIFICCLIVYFTRLDISINVVIVLIPVIFSAFLSYFEEEKIQIALTTGFSILTCFVPELALFLPLIAYDMIYSKYQFFNLFGIVPLVLFFLTVDWRTSLLVSSTLAFSIALRFRSREQLELSSKYNNLIDKTGTMSIQLKKQNNDLIEKQDFELTNATLNERNRIAREIHDNVGHLLSSAILQSGAILTINRDKEMEAPLLTLKDTLNNAMDSIRSSVHQLYDESVDLEAKIMEITERFNFCELTCDYQINGNPDKNIKYLFISVVKEALSNIMRHSDATKAMIILREHPALYQLIIRDNGRTKNSINKEGIGLKNMVERVEALKGNINILNRDGFEIFISIPKEVVK